MAKIELPYKFSKKDFPNWLVNPAINETKLEDLLREIDNL